MKIKQVDITAQEIVKREQEAKLDYSPVIQPLIKDFSRRLAMAIVSIKR